MTRNLAAATLALLVAALPLAAQTVDGDGFHVLFDGKSLDGWRANENPGSFKLDAGKLIVHGPRSHLFYEGGVADHAFENFVLEAEIQTKKGANSGLFFHTKWQQSGWPSHGYEAQVNSTHTDTIKSGSLYAVRNVTDAHSKDGKWFKMRVEVRRKHILIAVDGKTVVDFDEPANAGGTRRLSRGTFAIQAHDPNSEVWYRKIRVKVLPRWRDDMSRTERQLLKRPGKWWNRMDYGPFVSCSVGMGRRGTHAALKGITVPLGHDDEASVTFDTDLLRMAFGWNGGLTYRGVTFDGSHGGHPSISGAPTFFTKTGPGWASGGKLDDPRPIPHGPVPDAWGLWRGLHRYGDRVVLSYTVGKMGVLEMPQLVADNGGTAIVRNFQIEATDQDQLMVVADFDRHEVTLEAGLYATARRRPTATAKADGAQVIVDRTTGPWDTLAMRAPSSTDFGTKNDKVQVGWDGGYAAPHGKSGAKDDRLPRLTDGESPGNSDDPARTTFFDGGVGRMWMDLGRVRNIARINTYSRHRGDRAAQRFVLWASASKERPSTGGDLAGAGWRQIANVDTTGLGWGAKHGSCVMAKNGLGRARWLLFDTVPIWHGQGTFFGEIDVWTKRQQPPELKALAHEAANAPLAYALIGAPDGVRMEPRTEGSNARLVLRIPAGTPACRFRIAHHRGDPKAFLARVGDWKGAPDLTPYLAGGPALYPKPVVVKGRLGDDKKGKKSWVVDTVPVPFKNPWDSYMRVGGMDFFKDGTRAAVSTWNGDVWIVSGLDDDLDEVKWRRYATGLFETLGLRIVDDVIYVNGKDQITRLHDQNGDGEADFYECFNNDVYTTRNFHEFTFDLQTDSDGNFYIAKGSPVRGGGRGFEKIVPHHGTVMKISRDGSELAVYARGMRAPNGIGVGPNGQVTCGDNEGTWVPHCKLHWLSEGSFQGVIDVAHATEKPKDYNKPLCWFPMGVDNSGGGQVWVTSGEWGPFQGDLLHLSYGKSSIYKVMKEEVDGQIQGGVFRIPVKLASSAMRARFNPRDGQLWVCGLKGWQTNAAQLAGFQRVRRTTHAVRTPHKLRVTERGVYLTFTCALDPELANDTESYAVKHWNYVWGPQYGSPEVSADQPDPEILEKALKKELHSYKKHDTLEVKSATLQLDGRTVFLHLPGIKPVMQMHIKCDLESKDGEEVRFDIWNTINKLGKPSTN
ncbi:MAG: hypothetical protein CMJ18_05125 [Phycisphaeraceae bacterium]|nr:hypothetical protein [Phycisphaeraceae bacterium]